MHCATSYELPALPERGQGGDDVFVLPATVQVPKSTREIIFSHPNYDSIAVRLDRDFMQGMLLMDLLFTPGFGLGGILVDGTTSAWYEMPPIVEVDFDTKQVLQEDNWKE